jgi:hypothetical protein
MPTDQPPGTHEVGSNCCAAPYICIDVIPLTNQFFSFFRSWTARQLMRSGRHHAHEAIYTLPNSNQAVPAVIHRQHTFPPPWHFQLQGPTASNFCHPSGHPRQPGPVDATHRHHDASAQGYATMDWGPTTAACRQNGYDAVPGNIPMGWNGHRYALRRGLLPRDTCDYIFQITSNTARQAIM